MQCGRPRFDPWVGKISWRRKWQPTPLFLPGEFCGLRSLVSYSPRGHKESDTTERLLKKKKILAWFAISSSKRSFQPRYRTCISCISCIGRWILFHWVISDLLNQMLWVWSQHLALQQALMEILTHTGLRSTALVLACIPKQSSLSWNPDDYSWTFCSVLVGMGNSLTLGSSSHSLRVS